MMNNEKYCDLHLHSYYSDGTCSPTEVVSKAKSIGISPIALTDHNTVTGLPEFMAEANRLGVIAVGGTELSTEWDGKEFHLLGLFIKPEHYSKIEEISAEFHGLKEKSNIYLIEKLNEAGYDISFESVQKRNIKGRVNRAHIAAELLDKGYVNSISDAFDRLLDEKCGLYIPPKRKKLTEAIAFLRSIGALAFLAHPLKEVDADYLYGMMPELVDAGLTGIETMHSSYSDEKIAVSKRIAEEFSLLESGGSDFHGDVKPGVMLGVGKGNLTITEDLYQNMLNALGK